MATFFFGAIRDPGPSDSPSLTGSPVALMPTLAMGVAALSAALGVGMNMRLLPAHRDVEMLLLPIPSPPMPTPLQPCRPQKQARGCRPPSRRLVALAAPGSFALGFAVGPAIGGLLSQPSTHFPSAFGSTGLLTR